MDSMKLRKKLAVITAAALAVCLLLTSCSSQREDTGVAYDKKMSITSAKDLEGKAVAVQLLSPIDDYIVENKLTDYPRRYENLENAVTDLVDKKVAVIVTDAHYAKKLVEGNDKVKIVKGSIASLNYHFRFTEADSALAEQFNTQIAALKDSGELDTVINAELGSDNHFASPAAKELSGTATLVTPVGLKPFVYEDEGSIVGFLPAVSQRLAQACGMNIAVKTAYAAEVTDTVTSGEADEHRFCVTVNPQSEEGFVNTQPFYTSELVMIIRSDAKK